MIRRPPRCTQTDTRLPDRTLFRARKILRGERIKEVGQSEVDSDAGKPRKLERLNGYGHDLDGGGDAVGADQFSAHLRHLPFRTKLIRAQFDDRSEEHTSALQSLMRISYAVFCLKKKKILSNSTNKNPE